MIEIARDQRLGGVVENALELALGRRFHDGVHFLDAGGALGGEAQIDNRDIDGRHADGIAIELAIEFGQHQTDRSSSTGLGRDHVHAGRACPAQILVIDVGQHLIVGIGMHRGHEAGHQTDLVVQRLDQRCQAVGGARGIGDDRVAGLEHTMVHAIDHRRVDILATRGRDDDFLGAGCDVCRSFFFSGEKAGAFEHHIHLQFFPGQLGRVALGADLDAVAIDHHGVAIHRHRAGKTSVCGVKARQMGIGLGIAQIVDGNDLDVMFCATFIVRTQNIAADAAETIDGDTDGHAGFLFDSD